MIVTSSQPAQWASVVVACMLVACAGDLDAPERFDAFAPASGVGAAPPGGTGGAAATGGTGGAAGSAGLAGAPTGGTGGAMAGSGGTGGAAGTGGAGGCDVAAVLEVKCDGEFCHSAGSAQVDLVSPGLASRVVDQMSSAMGLCSGRVLAPMDGSEGLLLQKIEGTAACGSPMPIGEPLTATERACITSWLMSPGGM